MKSYPDHSDNILSLKKVEGQIRGIQKMIQERKYCVDILNQVQAAIFALASVQDSILEKHLNGCVSEAIISRSARAKKEKISEILKFIHRFRKL
jgi:CsoR family transcriptional regulator, copper-sensing transcriptional repressor